MDASLPIGRPDGGELATTVASDLAATQFWAIAHRQMLALGISRWQIQSWVGRGILHPKYPGVYAWGRAELSTEGELAAALLYAGPGDCLTSLTALWWRGLLSRRPALVHIDAPGRSRSRAGIRIHHPAEIARTVDRGLPVAALPRTLLAASTHLSHNALRLVLARADFGKQLDLTALDAALGPGRPGTRAVRRALAAHLPQLAACVNGFEREFVLLCERGRLELPEPNVRIGRYRPDMLWREAMLIVELDGRDAHSSAAQLAADRRRQAELEALGFRVIRFGVPEVRRTPDAVLRRVRLELSRLYT